LKETTVQSVEWIVPGEIVFAAPGEKIVVNVL